MNKISMCLMFVFLVQGCAGLNQLNTRQPSQEIILECTSAFKNIELGAEKILSLAQSKIISERLKNCSNEDGMKIDPQDRLMYFKAAGSGVLIKTLHGKLLYLENNNLSVVELKFPVASFLIENDHVSLYNANDKSRFCTSQVIENHLADREPSCKNATDRIAIKDL